MELTVSDKQSILDQRISSIDLRISILQTKVDSNEENKEGLPSFEDMLAQEVLKKAALIEAKESL